jgi:hypothetical protein
MTNNFDSIYESLLSELAPAEMVGDFGSMSSRISKKVEDLPGKSQHWSPLQKLSPETREGIIHIIIKNVFTERGNRYTPMADDPDQLKDLIKSAIIKAAKAHPEFKASGKWAVQFLADRLSNKELMGDVKYTSEGGEEIKKDVTQKEMKAALNKALADTKGQSVWRKSSQEEAPLETAPEEPAAPVEPKKEVEEFYVKAADLDSDDSDLQAAFKKLPEDKEMTWSEVLKKIGMSKGIELIDAGGLNKIEREVEAGENEYVPALDADDNESPDLSNFDRIIDPYFSTTKGSHQWED